MKLKVLLAALCLSCGVTAYAASSDIGVVDMNTIFKNSPQVQKKSKQLQTQFAKQRKSIMQMDQDLQKTLAALQKNSATMSKKQLATKRAAAMKQEEAFRLAQQKFQSDVMTAQNSAMASFMVKVRAAAADLAKKDHLQIVLPKNAVLYSSSAADLTSALSKQLAD